MLHAIWIFVAGSWQDPTAYNFISGPLADASVISGLVYFVRKHGCHVHRCWRIGKHIVDGTPYIVCRKHHPAVPEEITPEHVQLAHELTTSS